MKKKKSIISLLIVLLLTMFLVAVVLFLNDDGLNDGGFAIPGYKCEKTEIEVGQGIYLIAIGKYTGSFVEDGSDEEIENVLAVIVENRSESDIQLARITLEGDGETYNFEAVTLPVGSKSLVMEKSRNCWEKKDYGNASLQICALFQKEMSLYPEQFQITTSGQEITIKNIGKQIGSKVHIYYKNRVNDIYLGGITYRVGTVDGLEAEETCNVMSNHYTEGSEILFVTYGEE